MKASLVTPSKINLFLRVAGKRTDGYHNLETIFLPLKDLCDVITINFQKGDSVTISSSNPNIPCDSRNFCHKAAKLYLEKASLKSSLKIDIDKRIPVTAGMGGGSSDAGAVLLILQNYFKALSHKTLSEIALKVGADVPFFLKPEPSAAYGVGEILNGVHLKENFIVVICAPQFPVSAAWAYKNLVKQCICEKLKINELISYLQNGNYDQMLPLVKNDLAQALYNKFPILNSIRDDLIGYGLDAAEITGSGPTIFGITRDADLVQKAISKLNTKYGSVLCTATSQILTKPYQIVCE